MKRHAIIWMVSLLVLFSVTACSVKQDAAAQINRDTVLIKPFAVSTNLPGANTTAHGDVYVQKTKDDLIITVAASVEIGEHDWGGVQFYIPHGWTVSRALASYPGGSGTEAGANAAIWHTADTGSKWKSYVEIGHDSGQKPTGGGTGTVLIEISAENTNPPDAFSLLVSVGSELKDGVPVVGTASTLVEIDSDLLSQ